MPRQDFSKVAQAWMPLRLRKIYVTIAFSFLAANKERRKKRERYDIRHLRIPLGLLACKQIKTQGILTDRPTPTFTNNVRNTATGDNTCAACFDGKFAFRPADCRVSILHRP